VQTSGRRIVHGTGNSTVRLPPVVVVQLEGAMLSDRGCVRDNNEDCAAYVLPRAGDPADRRPAVAIVADGMGGHAAGEVASRLACEIVLRRAMAGGMAPPELMREAITQANAAILAQADGDGALAGMGTTLSAVLVADGLAWLGHVGDSRIYILRGGRLHQLSRDDSLVAEMVRRGLLSADEARVHPDRNVIYKAVGTAPDLVPSVCSRGLPMKPGDRLLLCSDGLTDLVPNAAIARELARAEPLDACRSLVQQALDAGGHDNITVGVFHVVAAAIAGSRLPPDTRVPMEGRAA
jgi:serine/threonine protein phosphatase PrpC